MNRTGRLAHRTAPPFALAPALVLLCCGATFGQLSDAVKRAPAPDNAAIQRHVTAAAQNLASDDPDKQARGRDDIAGGAVPAAGDAPASPQYLDAYAAAVAKAIAPLTQHQDMRVRLNAAIASARVAERAGNNRLTDVTVRFMADKTSAVALWGVKAARSMLPTVLGQGGAKNPLLDGLVQVAQRFLFGPIVTEIYDALSLNVFTANPPPPPAVVKGAIPQMLRVFRVRVDSYGGGVPPDPAVDNIASEFLSFGPVWQTMTPPQRTEAVQGMADLLTLAGQHTQFMEGEDRQTLMPVFKRTGAALQVIGDALKNAPVSTAAKEVTRISSGMDGSEIISKTGALTAALQKAVPGVKPSPTLPPPPTEAEAEATGTTPPAGAAPGNDGKAPPAGNNPARGGQSAGPGPDLDTAQPAGDAEAPPAEADAGAEAPPADAKAPPAPRAPGRPSR